MKIKSVFTLLLMFMLVAFTSTIFAEEKSKKDEDTSLNVREKANYLQISHAKDKSNFLLKKNRSDIYRLKIMTANMGSEEQKKQLEDIFSEYKKAAKLLYKSRFIESLQTFNKNYKEINKLYKSLADDYRKKAAKLLNKCADELVENELGASIEPGKEQNNNSNLIRRTRTKLMVGYNQLKMGNDFSQVSAYAEAIASYRVAKYHAIQILLVLAKTKDDRDKLEKEYAVDLFDSNNRIHETKIVKK